MFVYMKSHRRPRFPRYRTSATERGRDRESGTEREREREEQTGEEQGVGEGTGPRAGDRLKYRQS